MKPSGKRRLTPKSKKTIWACKADEAEEKAKFVYGYSTVTAVDWKINSNIWWCPQDQNSKLNLICRKLTLPLRLSEELKRKRRRLANRIGDLNQDSKLPTGPLHSGESAGCSQRPSDCLFFQANWCLRATWLCGFPWRACEDVFESAQKRKPKCQPRLSISFQVQRRLQCSSSWSSYNII